MSSIDDPIEAVRMQHREQPDKILDIILEIAGKLDPFTGVVSTIKKHFSQKEAAERVMALFKAHELVIRGLGKDIKDLEDRLQSPEYIEALIVAVHESLRTSNLRKVQRFASILGYELALGKASLRTWEDAAAFIRDLAELGEADIQALKILDSVQSDLLDDEVTLLSRFLCPRGSREKDRQYRQWGDEPSGHGPIVPPTGLRFRQAFPPM